MDESAIHADILQSRENFRLCKKTSFSKKIDKEDYILYMPGCKMRSSIVFAVSPCLIILADTGFARGKSDKKGRKPYFFSFADWYLLLRLFFAESWRGNGIDYFVLTLFLSRSLYIHLHMREKSRLASLTHVRRRLSDHRTLLSFVPTGAVCGMPHLPKISVYVCVHECSPLSVSLSPLVFLSLSFSFVGPPHHRSAHGPDLDCLPSLPFPPLRNGKCISATLSGRRRRRRGGVRRESVCT